MDNLTIILLFTGLFIVESIALYAIKKYDIVSSGCLISIAVLCYSVVPLIVSLILSKGMGIGTVNLIWNVMSNVYGLLIGLLLFSESIYGLQWMGILFAFSGVGLIILGSRAKN